MVVFLREQQAWRGYLCGSVLGAILPTKGLSQEDIMFKRLGNNLSKRSLRADDGPSRKLFFRYRCRSDRNFQSRVLFSSNTNLRSTIRGLLRSVTPVEARRVWYQVSYPSGQGDLSMDELIAYVETHTVLGFGSATQMDVVVRDVPPNQKSQPKHRRHASGLGPGDEVKAKTKCVVQ